MIERDIRDSHAALAVEAFYESLFRPGEGLVWTATDLDLSVDGRRLHFSGQCFEGTLEDGPSNAIYQLDLANGDLDVIAAGRLYRNAADGRAAHVEGGAGGERVIVTAADETRIAVLPVMGRVEALAWSPGARGLLIVVADPGADVAGVEGGFALRGTKSAERWLPDVASSDATDTWRRIFRWSGPDAELVSISAPPVNIWEASWLGDDAIVVIASDHHGEGSWYEADVRILEAASGNERSRYEPVDQVGVPAGSPSGSRWAAIAAFCSDRGIICGTALVGEGDSARSLDLGAIEVTDLRWRDEETLVFAGVRGPETIVGTVDVGSGAISEIWKSQSLTIGPWYPKIAPFGDASVVAVVEGYDRPPAIARLSDGQVHVLADLAPARPPAIAGEMRHLRWRGRDGLEIDGWLVLPAGEHAGLPLLVDVHGGPVSAHRNRYAATFRAGPVLVAKGYALLLPNPCGSGGRGQSFAKMVQGDMGGEDVHDYLAGIDHLIAAGIVDPARVAVSGTSYGGFMSALLVTRTHRFAAAVPISPVSNWYSQHFASQIPWFDEAFLDGSPREPAGQYFDRSPVFAARGATTPTLVLAGGRDKNTPTSQATELYGALVEAGVETALAIYPEDGHSLRGYPAYLDSAARIVDWLDRHLGKTNA